MCGIPVERGNPASGADSCQSALAVNEVGREIFRKLPVETTSMLLESLVRNFKDEPKYDMRRFKKLLGCLTRESEVKLLLKSGCFQPKNKIV